MQGQHADDDNGTGSNHSGDISRVGTVETDDKVQTVNRAKELEERVLRHLDALAADKANDQRMVAIARTGIQEAFMWANRAVFQPGRVKLPEDAA